SPLADELAILKYTQQVADAFRPFRGDDEVNARIAVLVKIGGVKPAHGGAVDQAYGRGEGFDFQNHVLRERRRMDHHFVEQRAVCVAVQQVQTDFVARIDPKALDHTRGEDGAVLV